MATSRAVIPAQYAKFITAVAGNALAYLTAYGATWHLQPALVGLGAALAVFGVPNAGAAGSNLGVPSISTPPPGNVTAMPVGQVVRAPVPSGNMTVTAVTPPAEPPVAQP